MPLEIQTSKPLSPHDLDVLSATSAPGPIQYIDDLIDVYGTSDSAEVSSSDQTSYGYQYSIGVDPQTILAILILQIPAKFFLSVVDSAGKDFWNRLKDLTKRVADRDKGIPVDSLQITIRTGEHQGIGIYVTITCIGARYLSRDAWNSIITQWSTQLNDQLDAARTHIDALNATQRKSLSKSNCLVLHARIDGQGPPIWNMEITKNIWVK